jgi:hypothetical protein
MPRCTFTELIMMFGLLGIFIPNLCLFLIINVQFTIYNRYGSVCWFPRLVLEQRRSIIAMDLFVGFLGLF